ncbi:MAG: hypothetical protein AAB873_03715 [Patescibacteria group bacterium]
MTWAFKRQLLYMSVVVLFVVGVLFYFILPSFKENPTCMDGKQNGSETGVDCGGSCLLVCAFEADPLSVLWTRTFQVIPGRYNAVAYIENHNKNAAVQKIRYKFRFSDKDNIYIGKREGETFIPPSGKFAIFEAGIGVGNSIPVYTSFEFTEMPVWKDVEEDKMDQLKLLISDIRLENQNTNPRLSAKLRNTSLLSVPEVDVVVILYDKEGNALSASRTYLEELKAEEVKDINFTWPEPIKGDIVLREIIPMYDIFRVELK